MFREEMKKLYVKQSGLILTIFFIIGEIIFVNFLYPKRFFPSEFTEHQFYEYGKVFSGELTPEKETAILTEQECIIDAQNFENTIENKLRHGEYLSESEFIAEYEKNHQVTKREEAFNIIFQQYSYALEAPQKRYMTVGDYGGLGSDIPDTLLLTFVILMTARLFLNEETSNVITFVRISENGKKKTLFGKIFSLLIFIMFNQIFRTLLELFTMISRGSFQELAYPVQSIEYFQNCPYNISIMQAFFAISTLRLLGYLFIASLVMLLSVTLRNALLTVFIPSSVCLLQQFAFNPATPAYYILTGFLRAVGFFYGNNISKNDLGESITLFGKISLSHLITLIIITLVFIVISVIAAYAYYDVKPEKYNRKPVASIFVLLLCFMLSGCSQEQVSNVVYNFCDCRFFAQCENFYFIQSNKKITAFSKDGSIELDVLRDAFITDDHEKTFMLYDDGLFHVDYYSRGNVYKFSLDTFSNEIAVPAVKYTQGFLGVKFRREVPIGFKIDGIFTNGESIYYIYFYSRQVYTMKNGNYVRILEDNFLDYNLSFDGERIYYINSLMQLKCYNTKTGEELRLPGELVQTIYYDGTRLLYSDMNGIFALNTSDLSVEKISDIKTNQLTSDGREIVYRSGDELFLLGNNISIYTDAELSNYSNFAVISDVGKFVIQSGVGVSQLLDLPDSTAY